MRRNMKNRRRERRGFTLMELMLVLVILSVIGSFGIMAIMNTRAEAFRKIAEAKVKEYNGPLGQYALTVGDYPATEDGLEALYSPPSRLSDPSLWRGPYITKPPENDPWGRPYQYEFSGSSDGTGMPYRLWSMGPDGISGTADDIGNW